MIYIVIDDRAGEWDVTVCGSFEAAKAVYEAMLPSRSSIRLCQVLLDNLDNKDIVPDVKAT